MSAASGGAPGSERPRGGSSPRVGYLLKCFPRISETFILNEVLELERQGVDLRVYSMNEPQEPLRHRLAERVVSPVEYLPYPLLRNAAKYLRAHLALFLRHPLRYLGTLAIVAASFDRDLWERFVQAGMLAKLLRRDGVGHVHAGFVHFPGSVAWIVHRVTGVTFSLATHAKDMVHSPPNLLRKKLNAAELVLTCTGFNVPELEKAAAPGGIRRLRKVYHGTDLSRFPFIPPGEREPSDSPLILTVGRLVTKKGFDHLITACGLLRDRGRSFRCLIVAGSRDLWDPLHGQIHDLQLDDLVKVEGPLDQAEVARAYREAAVFALPCVVAADGDRDGIPNVLVEASASGLPIVSTDVSGIPELVQDGKTGLVVPPRDPSALAGAIERLLDSPALRHELAAGARQHVEEVFDLHRNAVTVARELTTVAAGSTAQHSRDLAAARQGVAS